VGLQESEEELDLNYCKESSQEPVPYALSNSLGFGGHNASLLIGKYL
jgi:3-oxoacyl-[acyl-carrier-protein] synthase II